MSTRCPACGEFIGDNTFGKSPHHNCGKVINWNAVELASTDPRDAEIAALRAELERKDAALRDFAAAWREVAHRSGVKLEAWEDDEYILSAPERGPCGMTIHRRHATVLNAALENLENNDAK